MAFEPCDEAELVRAFVNTLDVERGTDEFADNARLASWLEDRGFEIQRVVDADRTLAVGVREGLRALLATHQDSSSSDLHGLDELARQLPLRVAFAGGVPHVVAATGGVPGALASVLAACATAAAQGRWQRLKVCPAEDCQWAFYDQSKNRSRRWCAMGVCGNRHKARVYRERCRAEP